MTINGIEFDFSTLNANDVERMVSAQKRQQERAKEESGRYTPDGEGYPAWLRFQCRIFMDYLDEVLGDGAAARLGLDGSNFSACLTVSKAFAEAMAAEKASVSAMIHPAEERAQAIPAPMNREQRRAAAKQHHQPMVDFQAREAAHAPAAQGNTPADAQRAQAAIEALKDDPEAMRQLAEAALKIAAAHNG